MNQNLFLLGLYILGVYFGLLFKRQLPCALIGITGFLWGALIWVVGGITLQVLAIPYTPGSMVILFSLLGIGFTFLHIRRRTWQLSLPELISLLALASAFLLVLIIASQFNYSIASEDSIIYINVGRRIAGEGFSSQIMGSLALRGVFLFLLQSASVFLGDGYIFAAQPAFAFTFILLYYYLTKRILSHQLFDQRLVLVLSILSCLVLFSTYFIVFQFFYIHTNLISAVYLFLAVCAYWLASAEENDSWMFFGTFGLLGFSLARTEAPVFALIFLVLAISSGRVSYKARLLSLLPYLFILISWYLYLLLKMEEGTYILNQDRTLVIIGSLVASALLVILSQSKWVKRYILPYLPKIMLGSLLLLLLFMITQKPDEYRISTYAFILNVLESGRWGITWLVFGCLFLLSLAGPRFPREELFLNGLLSFFTLLLAIAYFRTPYRVGWGDSANRIWTHIIPIFILFVLMKFSQGSKGKPLFDKINHSQE